MLLSASLATCFLILSASLGLGTECLFVMYLFCLDRFENAHQGFNRQKAGPGMEVRREGKDLWEAGCTLGQLGHGVGGGNLHHSKGLISFSRTPVSSPQEQVVLKAATLGSDRVFARVNGWMRWPNLFKSMNQINHFLLKCLNSSALLEQLKVA